MRILITNDDGIYARGIRELIINLSPTEDVYVVAPGFKLSGISGGVTFDRPVRVDRVELSLGEREAYAVSGTPADCVILALDVLVKEIDLVISGINDEPNIGDDIRFSGTIGACIEAAFSGKQSIAVSLNYGKKKDFYGGAVSVVKRLIDILKVNRIPEGTFLNVNVPNIPVEEIKGVKFTRLGRKRYKNRVHKILEPCGSSYFWIGGIPLNETDQDSEDFLLREGYIVISPLKVDKTDYQFLEVIKTWKIGLD